MRKSRTKIFLAGISVGLMLAFVPIPGNSAYAAPTGVAGIDVSTHNGQIDWRRVAEAGVKWAYAKASEGTYFTDQTFAANYGNAKANSVFIGAYHFARPEQSDGRTQADYFLARARYVNDGRTLPPMLDIEMPWQAGTPRCWGLSRSALARWILDFTSQVRTRTGRNATIYTNYYWWQDCVGPTGDLDAYPLFIANHSNVTSPMIPPAWSRWTFWQYTSNGSIPGIDGNVDRNVFSGSLAQLATLAGASTSPSIDGDGRAELTYITDTGQLIGIPNIDGINYNWGANRVIGDGWNRDNIKFA